VPQRGGETFNCTVNIKNLQIIYLFIIDECTSCISRYVYVRNRRASSLLGSDLERVAGVATVAHFFTQIVSLSKENFLGCVV